MKSCVTISLVPEAQGGPFVLWDELPISCRLAAELGFDAVEIFAPGPEAIPSASLQELLSQLNLELAAVGTGAGWVKHGLTLTAKQADYREAAMMFVESMIDMGGPFRAPAIIGSMQGRFDAEQPFEASMDHLAHALSRLAKHAAQYEIPLIYEPLNRYETNLCNTMSQGVELLERLDTDNVVLLADLFHMNIEEADVAQGVHDGGKHIGHVHFVDSNRWPVGAGHTNFQPIMKAFTEIDYQGYLSAEAFPLPDPASAARQTIDGFRQWTGSAL